MQLINLLINLFQSVNQSEISRLFQMEKDLLWELEQSPSVPSTLKLHKLFWSRISNSVARIDFHFRSKGKKPCFTQKYLSTEKCGHIERYCESLKMFHTYCISKRLKENESKNCLRYLVCMQWFHEACFQWTTYFTYYGILQ